MQLMFDPALAYISLDIFLLYSTCARYCVFYGYVILITIRRSSQVTIQFLYHSVVIDYRQDICVYVIFQETYGLQKDNRRVASNRGLLETPSCYQSQGCKEGLQFWASQKRTVLS